MRQAFTAFHLPRWAGLPWVKLAKKEHHYDPKYLSGVFDCEGL